MDPFVSWCLHVVFGLSAPKLLWVQGLVPEFHMGRLSLWG